MQARDIVFFSMQATTASRGRTILTLLAMAIGVSSVILLISLGDSGRRYVIDQFASLGTNLLIVIPGRSETIGGPPPLLGETPRDLTLDDAVQHRFLLNSLKGRWSCSVRALISLKYAIWK
jgi:putative ABC transport system permease protein